MSRLYYLLSLVGMIILMYYPSPIRGQVISGFTITKSFQEVSLEDVLLQLEKEYPIRFFYLPEVLPETVVNAQYVQSTLQEVLTDLFRDTEAAYMLYDTSSVIIARKDQLEQEVVVQEAVSHLPSKVPTGISYKILGDSTLTMSDQPIMIKGRLTDIETNRPLPNATIRTVNKGYGAITDQEGYYRMELIPGTFEFVIQATGYEDMYKDVKIFSSAQWDIVLDLRTYKIDEVLLRATATDQNVSSTQMGVDRLSIQQIKVMPAFLGEVDIIKSLTMLPGVNTVGEGATGFNVRGGSIDQNLVLQDEAPIFNTSHLLGFFSVFNADMVEGVTLYKGHIPAQYGGRIASVLDVQTKEGNTQTFQGRGGIGAVTSRMIVEGPIIRDKVSFIAGGRSSYSDWVLRLAKDLDVKASSAFFYDLNGKITAQWNPRNKLSVSAYTSSDKFQFSDQYGYNWQTQLATANYRHLFSDYISTSTDLVWGNYISSYFDPEGPDGFTLENGLEYYRIKQQFLWEISDRLIIRAGGVGTQYQARPEKQTARGAESFVEEVAVPKDKGREIAAYIQQDLDLNDRISLSLGVRYALFQYLGPDEVLRYDPELPRSSNSVQDTTRFGSGEVIASYGGWEPRAAVRIKLDENSSVKLSYNRMQQFIHLISNTMAATPVDIWQVSTDLIPPQLAHNYSVGYFRNFLSNKWETSFELYYKDIDQLVEYKDIPDLLLNPFLETELLTGKGRIYGGELYVKKLKGVMTGWLSYAYSRSLRRVVGEFPETSINEGRWFPANFDQPHQINMATVFRLNKQHTVSFNFTYATGRPITAPIADYQVGNIIIPHYTDRNQLRIPDYHRLDFSYTLEPNIVKRKQFKSTLTFSIYNLYFRKNAFSIFYERQQDKFIPDAFRLAVLGTAFPSVTYSFRF